MDRGTLDGRAPTAGKSSGDLPRRGVTNGFFSDPSSRLAPLLAVAEGAHGQHQYTVILLRRNDEKIADGATEATDHLVAHVEQFVILLGGAQSLVYLQMVGRDRTGGRRVDERARALSDEYGRHKAGGRSDTEDEETCDEQSSLRRSRLFPCGRRPRWTPTVRQDTAKRPLVKFPLTVGAIGRVHHQGEPAAMASGCAGAVMSL
jgi:hypothetical protein